MPPKPPPKETVKRTTVPVRMLSVSNCSLLIVPEYAVEGWQERLYRCVHWTLLSDAIRHHLEQCRREDLPEVSFSQGYQTKLKSCILNHFLDPNTSLTFQELWDITLAMELWDNNLTGTDEAKICFRNFNNVIDDYMPIIQRAVRHNDRSIILRGLQDSPLLRLNNCKITHLDETLKEHIYLANLILCGNYISELNCEYMPAGLRALELQANRISNLDSFRNLPSDLLYLGLSKNMLQNEGVLAISRLPRYITCLDLSDNDICDLEPLLQKLARLPHLKGLHLAGNPCSMSAAYAVTTVSRLLRLKYLDNRQILSTDRITDNFELQKDDLRSNFFYFTILRIISPPIPPKVEKGTTASFHVEFELPLLDSMRRNFLMTRRYESLTECLLPAEDDELFPSETMTAGDTGSKINELEVESEQTDIFAKMKPVNPDIIRNFTTFESPKLQWNKILTFPEPTLKLFCPDLTALRDTFRSTVTLKLVYSMICASKKPEKKSSTMPKMAEETRVTIAKIRCSLQNVDWSQPHQYFHWDDSLGTSDAIHWGDGDLHLVNYQTQAPQGKKVAKGPTPIEDVKLPLPDNLTCHFSFGVYTMQA